MPKKIQMHQLPPHALVALIRLIEENESGTLPRDLLLWEVERQERDGGSSPPRFSAVALGAFPATLHYGDDTGGEWLEF